MEGLCMRTWVGEVKPSDNATKIVYGRVHWEQLVWNRRQAL